MSRYSFSYSLSSGYIIWESELKLESESGSETHCNTKIRNNTNLYLFKHCLCDVSRLGVAINSMWREKKECEHTTNGDWANEPTDAQVANKIIIYGFELNKILDCWINRIHVQQIEAEPKWSEDVNGWYVRWCWLPVIHPNISSILHPLFSWFFFSLLQFDCKSIIFTCNHQYKSILISGTEPQQNHSIKKFLLCKS